jgi:uncharacterized protein YukE
MGAAVAGSMKGGVDGRLSGFLGADTTRSGQFADRLVRPVAVRREEPSDAAPPAVTGVAVDGGPGTMSRPVGEPATLSAGSRSMGGAAAALREVRARLGRTTSFEVVAGAWRGPASEAFLVDGAGLQVGLGQAADVLEQAAGALSELAARLEQAQSTWDRAQRLAAGVGVDLDSHGGVAGPPPRSGWNPHGGVLSPADAVDPAAMLVGGQAVRMAAAAEHEAAAARRAAAARLDQAARPIAASPPRGGPAGRSREGDHGTRGHGADRHGGPVRRAVGRALEAGAEVANATHHLVAGAEARIEAAGRLAGTADDPSVRAAAGRVAQSAARNPLMGGMTLGMLPLVAPILDFTASVSHGESLPRAFAGALGGAIGADLGGRAGLAICGGAAAATQGTGLIVCPTVTAVGGALGAQAGRTAALHVYDELTKPDPGPPHPEPAHPEPVHPQPADPGGVVRPGSGPVGGPRPGPGPGG